MRLDVADVDERDVEHERQRLRRGQPDQKRSDEPRPAGDGDGRQFVETARPRRGALRRWRE